MTPIDLTHPIHESMPVYPGTEQPSIINEFSIEKDGFREKKITLYSHIGTHMDAPAHLVKDGKFLDQYDIDRFHGSAVVVHLGSDIGLSIDLAVLRPFEDQLKEADFLLVHTDWSRHWGTETYFNNFPILTREAAEWVAGLSLQGIGFDTLSPDSVDTRNYSIHKILLESDMVIVENLTNLDRLPEGIVEFSCLPLHFQQADGAPIRAVAFTDKAE